MHIVSKVPVLEPENQAIQVSKMLNKTDMMCSGELQNELPSEKRPESRFILNLLRKLPLERQNLWVTELIKELKIISSEK